MSKLIIVRGLPGSGKSTIAARYEAAGFCHFESDMYFMVDGEYRFDVKKLHLAHEWCQRAVRRSLRDGYETVVSNTFTRMWEMKAYLEMAKEYGVLVEVITVHGDWGSVHGVPQNALVAMANRWEDYPGEHIQENFKASAS